jgi:hypothetical protein
MRSLAVAAVLAVAAGPAHADGGPPQTLGIAFLRGDPHSLYAMTNYGVIVSRDDGCTFRWICEANIGFNSNDYIPSFAVTEGGAILVATYRGLRASHDGGCTFEDAPGPVWGIAVQSVAVAPGGNVWVTSAESGRTNDVFVSKDGARTFTARGLASDAIMWRTVAIAPSDPARVYVTGLEYPNTAHLRRTDGTGWAVSPLTGIVLGRYGILAVAAIDPVDPDVVYVVVEDFAPAGDRLYRSTDGGTTFTEVLSVVSPNPGFTAHIGDVLARDGQVYVTTRLKDNERPRISGGPVYRSSDRGGSFAVLDGAPQLMCLGAAPDGSLVGCGANWEPDYMAVARFDGASWSKVWRWVELAGALECAPGTGGARFCDDLWSTVDIDLMTSGPACGPLARDAGVDQPKAKDPGCCSGSASQPSGLIWAFVLGFWLRRRKR